MCRLKGREKKKDLKKMNYIINEGDFGKKLIENNFKYLNNYKESNFVKKGMYLYLFWEKMILMEY